MHNKIRDFDPTRAMLEFVNGEQKVLSQRAACYRRLNKEQERRTGSYVSAFNGVSPAAKQKLNLYFDVSERGGECGRACVCVCVRGKCVRNVHACVEPLDTFSLKEPHSPRPPPKQLATSMTVLYTPQIGKDFVYEVGDERGIRFIVDLSDEDKGPTCSCLRIQVRTADTHTKQPTPSTHTRHILINSSIDPRPCQT